MDNLVVYIHGKGGSASESEFYKKVFSNEVIGFDYKSETPWEAKEEFTAYFNDLSKNYNTITVVANSIGAYFLMNAKLPKAVNSLFFISPIVDMENLINKMMQWANVSEKELQEKKEIETDFGETLSWEYYVYVKNNPLKINNKIFICYGENDNLTDYQTIKAFSKNYNAKLTVYKGGEHWFHTAEQMDYIANWIKTEIK